MLKKSFFTLITTFVSVLCIGGGLTVQAEEKKNAESYWSKENKPLIYGASSISVPKGLDFDIKDTRFRVFARDFEDGDMTQSITHSGKVDTSKAGVYQIYYTVKDSHGNVTTMNVPVTVLDDSKAKINVERTMYTTPSVWNMDIAGFSRCNYGDRQILGVYVPKGESVNVRAVSATKNLGIQFFANDSAIETSANLPSDGSWITIKNTKNGTDYDAVPVITTPVMDKGVDLNKTFVIELEYETDIPELNYYHEGDDEQKFRDKWNEEKNTYGVMENEVLTLVVPYEDLSKTTNYHKNGFKTLDEFFEYWQKSVEKMDEYVGLEFNPENVVNQNVRTKFLIRANAHGAGAAYYAGNHVGINSPHIYPFFEMNWGGLHELAHGYQGSLGKGEMGLGEVANNILGHYIQNDKEIYFHPGNWLGEFSKVEDGKNKHRLNGGTWAKSNVSDRLYAICNLFDHFEGGKTYGKMFQWYRNELNEGRTMTNMDAYAESLADIYKVNVIPYMEAWGLEVSDSVKEKIFEMNLPMISILGDIVSGESLSEIMANKNIKEKYEVVKQDVYANYTGNYTINIDIDNLDAIKGKKAIIKDANKIIKEIVIESNKIELKDFPVGNYYVEMPISNEYSSEYMYIQVKEEASETTYTYTKLDKIKYNNYLSLKVQGIYGTYGYELTFSNDYKKATVKLGGASIGAEGTYVKIYDDKGKAVSEEDVKLTKGAYYFNNSKGSYELDIKPGYKIEVYHTNKNRIKVFNTLTGKQVTEYNPTDKLTSYIVTKNGLRTESMSDDEAESLAYESLKNVLEATIKSYKESASDDELNNRYANRKTKEKVLIAYMNLRAEDQASYKEFIEKIKQGEVSTINEKVNLANQADTDAVLYSVTAVEDNENEGNLIDKKSVKVESVEGLNSEDNDTNNEVSNESNSSSNSFYNDFMNAFENMIQ